MGSKISQMPAVTAGEIVDTSLFTVVVDGVNKNRKATKAVVMEAFGVDNLDLITLSETNNNTSLASTGGGTNRDLALVPKGDGALTGTLQDNTATGGNARGSYANDWQRVRTTASKVASGAYSVIGGGLENSASGSTSVIPGGEENVASASYSQASGKGANAGQYGEDTHAAGYFSAVGDCQVSRLIARASITGTADALLYLNGSSLVPVMSGNNQLWFATVKVMLGCKTVGASGTLAVGDVRCAMYQLVLKKIGATVSLVGATQLIGTAIGDTSMSTTTIAITANDATNSLDITVTPPTGTTSDSVFYANASIELLETTL